MKRIDDHPRVQHVVDRKRLVIECRKRVLERAGSLIDRDLRHLPRRGAVFMHMAMRDHRVAAIRADISVRRLELALHRYHRRTLVADLVQIRDDAQHRVAHPRVDRRRRAPDHPGRTSAADIDLVQHPHVQPQHLGRARRVNHARVRKRHADQEAVDVFLLQPGVRDRLGRHPRHQPERGQVAGFLDRFEFANSNRRGFSL